MSTVGNVMGNVMGHTSGIQVRPFRDGTVSLRLRTEAGIKVWTGIPEDALQIEV